MFGFHWPELLILLLVGLLVFGPRRLPEISGALGRGLRDFRRNVEDSKEESGVKEIQESIRDVKVTVHSDPPKQEVEVPTEPPMGPMD